MTDGKLIQKPKIQIIEPFLKEFKKQNGTLELFFLHLQKCKIVKEFWFSPNKKYIGFFLYQTEIGLPKKNKIMIDSYDSESPFDLHFFSIEKNEQKFYETIFNKFPQGRFFFPSPC